MNSQPLQMVIDAFEQQWLSGPTPSLRAHFEAFEGNAANSNEQRRLLCELIPIDMEYRSRSGEVIQWARLLEDYLDDFSDLFHGDQPPLDLILEEYRVRHRWGDRPPHHSYETRFPQQADLSSRLSRIDRELKVEQPLSDGQSESSPLNAFRLEVTSGPHQGEAFSFSNYETLVVGRSRKSQLRLNQDRHLSRFHFRLEINPPYCRLIDLESTSGTFVNGERTKESLVGDGDTISGGQTEILIRVDDSEEQATVRPKPAADIGETTDYSRSEDELPQEFGEYEVTRKIGAGSMGLVLHAIQRSTQRAVALKLITPETAIDDRSLQMFVREASILCRLQHRRIVESYEFGLHERRMYLAMEYLEVEDLHKLLAQQSRPRQIRLACGVMERVAEALQHAHAQDIVHRDVKPANILAFRRDGKLTAKLGDFGLAKSYVNAGMSAISRDGEVKGTLAYMAPEQILDCRHAKPPCDIYAAGACLYHFLAGRPPYKAADARAAIAMILNEDPLPLEELAPDLPEGLVAIVRRAMHRDPSQRYSSAGHLQEVLNAYSRKQTR